MAPRHPRQWKNLEYAERSMGVSYGLIAAIVVFGAIGYFLDRELNTSPWLLVCGLAFGVLLGFYGLTGFIRDRS